MSTDISRDPPDIASLRQPQEVTQVIEDQLSGRSGVHGLIGVSAIAVALTVLFAAPVLRAPSERLFGTEIVGRHHDPFTVMQQFEGSPVLQVYVQPATDWLGVTLTRIVPPVAAYNFLVLWTFPLAAVFAYLFAYALTRSALASAVAALLFAFSPFHVEHAGYHVHIAQVQWIPLYFLALWKCLHGITPYRAAGLSAALGLVVFSNFYGGFIALTMTPVALLMFWLAPSPAGGARSWRDLAWTSALLTTLCTAALLTVRGIVPTVLQQSGALAFPLEDLYRFSARWWSYLVPPVAHPVLGGWSQRLWGAYGIGTGLFEQQVYIGVGVLLLSVAGFRAWARSRGSGTSAAVPFLAAVAAVALVCSLSPEREIFGLPVARPSAVLYLAAPMFRSYARFGVVVQLMIAIVAAVGVTSLWQRRDWIARSTLLALMVLTVFEYTPLPWRWRDVLPTSAHRWLAQHRAAPRAFDCTAWELPEQATAWLAGYPIEYLDPAMPDCGEPDIAGRLRALGVTDLLVRSGRPESLWLNAHARQGLRAAYRADDASVFEVIPAHPAVYVASTDGLYPREYNDAWSWRWTSGDATLRVENPAAGPLVPAMDVELASFGFQRQVAVWLNGTRVTDLVVGSQRAIYRISPLPLRPGRNELALRPVQPPVVAATLERNNDARPLALALGEWRWIVPTGGSESTSDRR